MNVCLHVWLEKYEETMGGSKTLSRTLCLGLSYVHFCHLPIFCVPVNSDWSNQAQSRCCSWSTHYFSVRPQEEEMWLILCQSLSYEPNWYSYQKIRHAPSLGLPFTSVLWEQICGWRQWLWNHTNIYSPLLLATPQNLLCWIIHKDASAHTHSIFVIAFHVSCLSSLCAFPLHPVIHH